MGIKVIMQGFHKKVNIDILWTGSRSIGMDGVERFIYSNVFRIVNELIEIIFKSIIAKRTLFYWKIQK